MDYTSNSPDETYQIAAKIAEDFQDHGGVITLSGELGAGKTTFVQGFAKALGIKEKVISPTFVLIRQHQIPNPENIPNHPKMLHHVDLYRLDQVSNLNEIGLKDIINDPDNIVLIEWPERLTDQIKSSLELSVIKISQLSGTLRQFHIVIQKQ